MSTTDTSQVGLFFGSFSPIHVGHLIVANCIVQLANLDQVWFVVSPQSPFKQHADLLPDHCRVEMVRLATADNPRLLPCDIELSLPLPSYTANTLRTLHAQHPSTNFSIIMGSDNLDSLHLWRDSQYILSNHNILVYPRPHSSSSAPLASHPSVTIVDTPMLDISSTLIRTMLRNGHDPRYLLPDTVLHYIHQTGLFDKQ